MYPQVFLDFDEARQQYDNVSVIPTPAFFYGMQSGEEITVEIEPGKTLIITYLTTGEPRDDGTRTVFFELNGQPREVDVPDRSLEGDAAQAPQGRPRRPGPRRRPDARQGVATSPSKKGQAVKAGERLLSHRGDEDGDGRLLPARGEGGGRAGEGGQRGRRGGFAGRARRMKARARAPTPCQTCQSASTSPAPHCRSTPVPAPLVSRAAKHERPRRRDCARRGELFAPAVVLTGRRRPAAGAGGTCGGRGRVHHRDVRLAGRREGAAAPVAAASPAWRCANAAAELTGDDGDPAQVAERPALRRPQARRAALRAGAQGGPGRAGAERQPRPGAAPAPLRERVTSLSAIAGRPLDMTDGARDGRVATCTGCWHSRRSGRSRCCCASTTPTTRWWADRQRPRRRPTRSPSRGQCEGLDEMGRLLLRSRTQLHRIISGQVQTT